MPRRRSDDRRFEWSHELVGFTEPGDTLFVWDRTLPMPGIGAWGRVLGPLGERDPSARAASRLPHWRMPVSDTLRLAIADHPHRSASHRRRHRRDPRLGRSVAPKARCTSRSSAPPRRSRPRPRTSARCRATSSRCCRPASASSSPSEPMTAWVALLRGVNVGGITIRNADLAALMRDDLGFDDVRTVLASGNVRVRGGCRAVGAREAQGVDRGRAAGALRLRRLDRAGHPGRSREGHRGVPLRRDDRRAASRG